MAKMRTTKVSFLLSRKIDFVIFQLSEINRLDLVRNVIELTIGDFNGISESRAIEIHLKKST